MSADKLERTNLEASLTKAFSPHMPINRAQFFAGRTEQLREVIDTIRAPGLHAAIYGERGAGKTSLANIINEFIGDSLVVVRVNCGRTDDFDTIIRRCLQSIQISSVKENVGFRQGNQTQFKALADLLPPDRPVKPDQAGIILSELPPGCVVVVDEFDRLPGSQTAAFADLIKSLSDRGAYTTIVLVGVAEDIGSLIESHASIERCLRQIHLQRMSESELNEIIDRGLGAAGFTLSDDEPRRLILWVSQGFPHFTHLLALYAGRSALDRNTTAIDRRDVFAGIVTAVERTEQSHRDLYYAATTGTRKTNLWTEVAAACALAESDERGYFSSRSVQEKLAEILNRNVLQQTVAFHLGKFTENSRGPLLARTGPERRYRYRFLNPLMRPFIIMKAIEAGLVGSAPSAATK